MTFVKLLSKLAFALAATAFIAAAALYWLSARPFEGVQQVQSAFQGIVAGRETIVQVQVCNTGWSTVQVVGGDETCGDSGCVHVRLDDGSIPIPGRSMVSIACSLLVRVPGPFRAHCLAYIDDGNLYAIQLTVQGTAVPASRD